MTWVAVAHLMLSFLHLKPSGETYRRIVLLTCKGAKLRHSVWYVTMAGTMADGQFLPGFMLYGIPVGDSRYVKHHLRLKVEEVGREVEQILAVLKGEGQAIWTVARASTIMKLDYHLALCYPTDMAEAAKEMDKLLYNMLESASGLFIPKVDEGRGVECFLQIHDEGIMAEPIRITWSDFL